MNDSIKLVKSGIFISFKQNGKSDRIEFVKYKKIIYMYTYEDLNDYKIFIKLEKNDRTLFYKDKNYVDEKYNLILNGWMTYWETETGIEKKLDLLINHIEFSPGLEEYEKAKNNFNSSK
jgi:hypothetical protein